MRTRHTESAPLRQRNEPRSTGSQAVALDEGDLGMNAANRTRATNESSRLVRFLLQPNSHAVPASRTVSLVQTHISWVFLLDRVVYKLKKPVRFGFLDFGTRERRRRACEREVELNRRLAPDTYLGVVPILLDARGHLRLGGPERLGTPVDYLVKMRRLPAEDSLERLLATDRLTESQIDEVASVLSDFYLRSPPVMLTIDAYRRRIEDHVADNFRELSADGSLDAACVRRVHAAQRRLLRTRPELFDTRVRDGRIVDGHGDLRPEHVYFAPQPTIIDCIEFNDEFRQIDVLDELGFLAMECDRQGAAWIGRRILDRYCAANRDEAPPALLDFYKSYRACVRAKVSVLRARQQTGAERTAALADARDHLQLADRYAATFDVPFVLLVRGLPGTGKSTLARALAEPLACDVLSTDVIRQELFGVPADESAFDAGRYSAAARERVYDELLRRAAERLAARESVLVDGTFLSVAARHRVAKLAADHGARFDSVRCTCPEGTARERIAARLSSGESASEARPEFLRQLAEREEPALPTEACLTVDTSAGVSDAVAAVLERVRETR